MKSLIGKKNTKQLYATFHELTLDALRAAGRNFFAPPLNTYDDYEEGSVDVMVVNKQGLGHIDKPGSAEGDEIVTEILKSDDVSIDCNLVLYLSTTEMWEEICNDLITILAYGICKLTKKLLSSTREHFNGLISDRYLLTIKKVNISAEPLNSNKGGPLKVIYRLNLLDEAALRPEGIEYEKVKARTKVGKK